MISRHFEKRCKQRCGIHNVDNKYFNRILEKGLGLDFCKSRPRFYSYLKNMCKSTRIPIIYNRYIIIAQEKEDDEIVAITILHLPKEFYSTVESLKKEKRLNIDGKRRSN